MLLSDTRTRHAVIFTTEISKTLQLSVVVPVFGAEATIVPCLSALAASDLPRSEWELIVVDDASNDGSSALAKPFADVIVTLEGQPRGPAFARNRGTEAARANIFCFVDSDVCVHPTALSAIVGHFAADAQLTAVFGSYDDQPRARSFVSQYRNLLHHYIHQRNSGEVESFWAGCGAIRRAAFSAAGGFDEVRYDRAQIEDVELGYRLRDRGYRILLDPLIRGTHLKCWTLGKMIRVDFSQRGLPWMQLLLERARLFGGGGLSVGTEEKASVALVGMVLLSVLLAVAFRNDAWLAGAVLCIVLLAAANRRLLGWYASVRGIWFAVRVLPMLVLYHTTNVAAASYGLVVYGIGKLSGKSKANLNA